MPADPTKTTTLRARYDAAMQTRLNRVWRDVRRYVRQVDQVEPAAFAEVLDQSFRRRVLGTLDANGLEIVGQDGAWQRRFLDQAYGRGLRRAGTLGRMVTGQRADLSPNSAIALLRRDNLYTRNVLALEKLGADTARRMGDALTARLGEGLAGEDLVAGLEPTFNRSRTQGTQLARTETVFAFNEASLDGFQAQGINALIPQVEFTTAGDQRVCAECLELSRRDAAGLGPGIFTISAARDIIPVHVQ